MPHPVSVAPKTCSCLRVFAQILAMPIPSLHCRSLIKWYFLKKFSLITGSNLALFHVSLYPFLTIILLTFMTI
jgi:hypothetical protein